MKLISATFKKLLNPESLSVVAGYGLFAILSFVLVKVLTKNLIPEMYGELALLTSVSGIINQFIFLPISQWVQRYYSVLKNEGHSASYVYFVKSIIKKVFALVFILSLISLIFPVVFSAVYGFSLGIGTILLFHYTATRSRITAALVQNLEILLRILFSLIFIKYFSATSGKIIFGYAVAATFVSISFYLKFRKHEKSQEVLTKQKEIFKSFKEFCLPYVGFAFLTLVTFQMDKWTLAYFATTHDVGLYSTLYQIANAPIALVLTIVTQFATPVVFEIIEDKNNKNAHQHANQYLFKVKCLLIFGILIICSLYYFLSDKLILFFADDQYLEVSPYLFLMGIAMLFFSIAQFYITTANLYKRPGAMTLPRVIYTVLFFILLVILSSRLGYVGVVYTHLISSVIYAGLMFRMSIQLKSQGAVESLN